jgi:Ohr subfamily peroxiredoxin
MLIEEVLCRAHVKATAGRDTRVVSSDGALDLKVSMPRELGGTNGRGTNPEQLFAAAYTSSFLGIVRLVAAREGIALPTDAEIDASVAVGATPRGFGIEVELRVRTPCARIPTPRAITSRFGRSSPEDTVDVQSPARYKS